jgi:hypothetical protein
MLASRKILTEEPRITLEVADLFLTDFIPGDYYKQKERRIAHTLLDQVSSLLDKAGTGLNQRETHAYREQPIPHKYDPARPIKITNGGRLYQDTPAGPAPLLLFGMQFGPPSRVSKLGYNSLLFETNGDYFRPGKRLRNEILDAATHGLAAHLLFSTHYITRIPGSSQASHVMMPYDILAAETRPILAKTYRDVLPPLRNETNLVSLGTANEPGYSVHANATHWEARLRQWLRERYDNRIENLDTRWKTVHANFDEINFRDVLRATRSNPAISYDWETFRASTLGTHFRFMREEIGHDVPDRMIWVKKYHPFGFAQIDPAVLFDEGSTIHDWSSILTPFSTDFSRGIDPSAPLSCTEWKLVPGLTSTTLDAPTAPGVLRVFENYARGLSMAVVWKWARRPWRAMGDHYTITRYPTAMDTIGRTGHRLQQLAPVFDRLSTLGDGSVAILYDKVSDLHQGSKIYEHDPVTGIEALYWRLNQNSAGVRILHAGRATPADYTSRRLIAAGTANALDPTTMRNLRNWVTEEGGTLWLTAPGALASDPWGNPHTDPALADLIATATKPGEHALGKGQVVVDPAWTGYESFLTGPYPVNTDDSSPVIHDVECRYVAPAAGEPGYIYILNRTASAHSIQLRDTATQKMWSIPANATEIWQQRNRTPATDSTLTLAPYEVLLFEIPSL